MSERTTKIRQRCGEIYDFLRNDFWAHLVCAILIAIGPALLGWASQAPADPAKAKDALPFTVGLKSFFARHPKLQTFFYFLPLAGVAAPVFLKRLDRKLKLLRSVDDDGKLHLLTVFDNVVGQKMETLGRKVEQRFSDERALTQLHESLFKSGSEQLQQIEALILGVYTMFDLITEDDNTSVKVTLALAKNDSIDSFVYFLPKDAGPITPMEKLRHHRSGFSVCIRERKLLIVENLRREFERPDHKRQFVCDEARDGSLICFPIYHRNLARVVFVVTVLAEKTGAFKEAERKKYEFVLKPFAKRLLVEYNLLALNNGVLKA